MTKRTVDLILAALTDLMDQSCVESLPYLPRCGLAALYQLATPGSSLGAFPAAIFLVATKREASLVRDGTIRLSVHGRGDQREVSHFFGQGCYPYAPLLRRDE